MKARGENKNAAALEAVRAVYRDLARRPIDRNCMRRKDCCHFKLTGRTPLLTKGEALLATEALRRTGRKALPASKTGACPLLAASGDCIIYESRPFGCRTHFCAAAGGPYARRDVIDLIRRLEELDAQLSGDGPHKLEEAVRRALEV
jgi:Fe-S-cluster containining protein